MKKVKRTTLVSGQLDLSSFFFLFELLTERVILKNAYLFIIACHCYLSERSEGFLAFVIVMQQNTMLSL